MELRVNAETGEIEEVESQNELIEKKLYEVGAIDKETFEMLSMYQYYEQQMEIFKYKLQKAMEENGIKKWDNDYFTATLTEETLRKSVDTQKLKDDGIYEKHLKLSPVKAGMRIKFKG